MAILNGILNSWNKLSIFKKVLVIVFCIFFFLISNITAINRGSCASSPCGGESFSFSDAMLGTSEMPSYYIHTASNPIFAPTSLLLLLAPYDKEIEINFPHRLVVGFDNNPNSEIDDNGDKAWVRGAYLAVKIIVLLSFPLWFTVSLFLVRKRYSILLAIATFLIISFYSLINLYIISDTGVTTGTWHWLLQF